MTPSTSRCSVLYCATLVFLRSPGHQQHLHVDEPATRSEGSNRIGESSNRRPGTQTARQEISLPWLRWRLWIRRLQEPPRALNWTHFELKTLRNATLACLASLVTGSGLESGPFALRTPHPGFRQLLTTNSFASSCCYPSQRLDATSGLQETRHLYGGCWGFS